MRSNPFAETRVHNCLRRGPNCNGFGHLALTTFCDPCNFWSKSFNVVLFFIKSSLCYKHGEVNVLNSVKFEFCISKLLDLFPDVVRGRAQNITTRDVVIFNQFRFCYDL